MEKTKNKQEYLKKVNELTSTNAKLTKQLEDKNNINAVILVSGFNALKYSRTLGKIRKIQETKEKYKDKDTMEYLEKVLSVASNSFSFRE
jgi:hypothetical protein